MAGRTVQLRVGGQTYRVVTSASEDELQRLAAMVDQKLAAVVPPGRAITPQAMLLAAMALAHDLEEERARATAVTTKARTAFGRMLERVDTALGATASAGGTPVATPAQAEPARPSTRPVPLPGGRPANES